MHSTLSNGEDVSAINCNEVVKQYLRAIVHSGMKGQLVENSRRLLQFGTHGKLPTSKKPRPDWLQKMQDNHCFFNSHRTAMDCGLVYVEGFAVPDVIGIPIHHAWCETREGEVLDPTWRTLGVEYFGIRFDRDYMIRASLESGYYGITMTHRFMEFLSHGPEEFLWRA